MESAPNRQPVFCFDRTPLLIGVVILPLAASCVLMAGGMFLRTFDSARSAEAQLQLRIALAERERREENHELARADNAHEDEAVRGHTTSTPAHAQHSDLQVATVPSRPLPDEHAEFSQLLLSPFHPLSPRAPPHART